MFCKHFVTSLDRPCINESSAVGRSPIAPDDLQGTPETARPRMATKLQDETTFSTHGAAAVLEVAEKLYRMRPEWVVFFREVLGVDGIVRRAFRTPEALVRFECSSEYTRIREMLDDLRTQQRDRPAERETQRVVTVRMPRSLHESLKAEAEEMRVSINTLCISKLLKMLDESARRELAVEPGPRAGA
ncbi:MAG: toxin-antitoxin system HicB family antitoxin, partial [Planctomycetia bacterium]|nr:toxin-antitoxin system HicB family antitoxin [Planctomycetia bacterium]